MFIKWLIIVLTHFECQLDKSLTLRLFSFWIFSEVMKPFSTFTEKLEKRINLVFKTLFQNSLLMFLDVYKVSYKSYYIREIIFFSAYLNRSRLCKICSFERFYIQSFSLTECIGIVGVRKYLGCLSVCLSVCRSV